MKKHSHAEDVAEDLKTLAEDAKMLMSATAHVAEEKVVEARKRLAAALERGKDAISAVRDKTMEGAKAVDEKVRNNPYQAVGIAFGVGAILGYLLSTRRNKN
jgi:ElaB/YqjD/DUF883 family membrane-anchored ribosome-binding protein